ncbi:hypothetical protein ACGFYV_08355 [Streptomyces sp. NPDC048297]|uniref:hypothetical protein n=1 Tax=Streptomyces sp. NPDC048297 TaxID=3365531 RepID=UPI0037182D4B
MAEVAGAALSGRLFGRYGEGVVLPSEGGSTPGTSSWASGLFDGAREAVADVAMELSSFTTFHKRVDALIHDLKGSQAGPGGIGQE